MKEQICNRCIMSTKGDPRIKFDAEGNCNYCSNAIERMKSNYLPNEKGNEKLKEMLNRIKQESKECKYDCIMGISGGLDSSYLLYLGSKWGLRILAIHIDDGFDTDTACPTVR